MESDLPYRYGKQAIGYVRVSTSSQERSGLGLEAQRQAIEEFAEREGLTVNQWFTEAESGAGINALAKRPQLAATRRTSPQRSSSGSA